MLLRAVIAALSLAACLQIANMTFAPARGLQAEYFNGEPGGRPALTGIDADASTEAVQRRWLATPPTNFSIRWFGFLTIDQPGRYTFSVSSDDGALFSIDGSIVIDFQQWGGRFAMEWQMAREGEPLASPPRWSLTPQKVGPRSLQVSKQLDDPGGLQGSSSCFETCSHGWLRRLRSYSRGSVAIGSSRVPASHHWRSSLCWR